MQIKKAMTMGITAIAMTLTLGAYAGINHESVTVNTRDLDLRTEEGQKVLHSRLQGAAREVCGDHSVLRPGSLRQTVESRSCYQKAMTKAVESVDSAGLKQANKKS